MGLNFKQLATKVGETGKELVRNGLVEKGLELTGQDSMNGIPKYAEYEYDSNGHIKGVNSKYAKMIEEKYSSGTPVSSKIDGNYGGLTTSISRQDTRSFIDNYPGKYDNTKNRYENFSASEELGRRDQINKEINARNESIFTSMAGDGSPDFEAAFKHNQNIL